MRVTSHRDSAAVALLRDATARFLDPGDWKQHLAWLALSTGEALGAASMFLYRIYRNEGSRTAVRLNCWHTPAAGSGAVSLDEPVLRFTSPMWQSMAAQLESGTPVIWPGGACDHSITPRLRPTELGALVVVPIEVEGRWWGFLGCSFERDGRSVDFFLPGIDATSDALETIALLIAQAVRAESRERAFNWSERLHRIQRDVALAGNERTALAESLTRLLELVCQVGGFDIGVVDLHSAGGSERIASLGRLPEEVEQWVDEIEDDLTTPAYIDRDDLDLRFPQGVPGNVHAAALLPIVHERELSAVLMLFSSTRTHVPASVRHGLEAVIAELSALIYRIRANREMQRTNDRQRRAVEDGRIGIWELDLEQALVFFDPATAVLFGLPPTMHYLKLRHALRAVAPKLRERIWSELYEAPHAEQRFHYEVKLQVPGGDQRWFSLRAATRPGTGSSRTIAGSAVDITEFKRVQRKLTRAQRLADESSRAKSDFLARMTHELRTPLNAILGYAQVMQGVANASHQEPAEMILRSAKHLLEMVDNVLNQSKLESGRLQVTPNLVNLDDFLRSLESEFRGVFRDEVAFAVERESRLPNQIMADQTRLRQVLHNLIGNAAKFTETGSVTLRVRWRRRSIRFAVSDTGPGIAQQHVGHIFLPFQQPLRRGSGTGLGLSISQELVQLMGSRIWVESRLGKGSIFWFSLEIAPEAVHLESEGPLPARATRGRANLRDAVHLPDDPGLEELRRLLAIGDIAAISERAQREMSSEGEHAAFYTMVYEYASRFRLGALRKLLEREKNE
ncbi:MAG: sensor histidine kinase [Spirochaetales bacterium]